MGGVDVSERFAALLGAERVIVDGDRLTEYRGIAWGPPSTKIALRWEIGRPTCVVRPRSTEDVVGIVGLARTLHVPLVPYGAGTGVQAGATPLSGSVVVDLGGMQRIIAIQREDFLARVEPGVVLGDLDAEAAHYGLMVGHDPWSQPIASVGGAISTNGVGYLAGKYGPMGDQVVALEVVLGTGEVLTTRPIPKASTGPQLRSLFIGAEGTLGLITRIDLRLFPVPERRIVRGYWFPRFETGLAAIEDLQAMGLRPAMVDFEEDSQELPPLGTLPATRSEMYFAFEGFAEEVDGQLARADAVCQARDGEPMLEEDAQRFWDTRHQSAERYLEQRRQGSPWSTRRWAAAHVNIALPTSAILAYRQEAARVLAEYHMVLTASGLWAMPEMFSARFEHVAPESPTAVEEADRGADAGLRLAQTLGGSMEYCHGVGLRYAHLMDSEWGSGLQVLRRIKRALDPDGLLNPGKLDL